MQPKLVQPLLILLDQPGKLRAYKLVTNSYDSPMCGRCAIHYEIGKRYSCDDANTDITEQCGAGINVATWDYILREYQQGWRVLEVEFTANDIACIPTATDGKFRLHRCKVTREVSLDEAGITAMLEARKPEVAQS